MLHREKNESMLGLQAATDVQELTVCVAEEDFFSQTSRAASAQVSQVSENLFLPYVRQRCKSEMEEQALFFIYGA